MEEYAKHVIEINFCDDSSIYFNKCSDDELYKMHDSVNKLIDWVNE